MEKEFVPYELAVKLKELGFDEPCIGWYNPQVNYKKVTTDRYWAFHLTGEWENFKPSPLYQQAFRWFREEYGYWCYIKEATKGTCRFYIEKFDEKFFNSDIIYSYEQSEISCLEKLIEIVELKKE